MWNGRRIRIPKAFGSLFKGRSMLFKGRVAFEVKRRGIDPHDTEAVAKLGEELWQKRTR
jgi:hypothetical protein